VLNAAPADALSLAKQSLQYLSALPAQPLMTRTPMTRTPANGTAITSSLSPDQRAAASEMPPVGCESMHPAGRGRPRFRALISSLATSLVIEPEAETHAAIIPFVYTTAIQSSADLVASLTGISRLARELGFQSHPETCYAPDGSSASWHADHGDLSLSLSVDCNPRRGTVSIAVSGLDGELTHRWFRQLEASLFGTC